jgi:hypothetical protein
VPSGSSVDDPSLSATPFTVMQAVANPCQTSPPPH